MVKIALVGRPNVGKSALFNRICKKKLSIVDEKEGVTRDRIYAKSSLFGRPFELIDTGGITFSEEIDFFEQVRQQAEIAILEADSLIMVVDGRVGPTQADVEVARILLKTKKPLVLAVNKVDEPSLLDFIFPFYELGIEHMVGVSALHDYQIAELLEKALSPIPMNENKKELQRPKVALLGKPNVGKSTLLNSFLTEARSIVSPIAGTTRDAIDELICFQDKEYIFIDTAGIKRKNKEKDSVEKFASIRTKSAIERADVCLVMLDAQKGLSLSEKKILKMVEKEKKPCVIFLNKWDLVKDFRMETALRSIKEDNPFIEHCPVLIGSAMTKRNTDQIIKALTEVYEASHLRPSTPKLNQFIEKTMQAYHPPRVRGKRLRIYYMVQTASKPPKFVLFVNSPQLMVGSYKRYLLNAFRKTFHFPGCPIEFQFKGKKSKEAVSKQKSSYRK